MRFSLPLLEKLEKIKDNYFGIQNLEEIQKIHGDSRPRFQFSLLPPEIFRNPWDQTAYKIQFQGESMTLLRYVTFN